jgi:O-antigen/teichoic acid export membrane protein
MVINLLRKLLNTIPVSDKFKIDTIWNAAALGLFGLSALFVSIMISKYFEPGILGIFNLNFALFMIISQLAGSGIHYSCLYKLSHTNLDSDVEIKLITNGLAGVLISSGIITLLTFLIIPLFGILFDNTNDSSSLFVILPAIFFLSVNKVLLSYFNARREMKKFALANIIRAVLIVVAFSIFLIMDIHSLYFAGIFSISEFIVFVFFISLLIKNLKWGHLEFSIIKNHFVYGVKSLSGSIFLDINTKVDVLMLGLLLNDYAVGIYTLPAFVIEGFQQLPLVFRNVINPQLTSTYNEKGADELGRLVTKGKQLSYRLLIPFLLIIIMVFTAIVWLLNLWEIYNSSVYLLIILAGGCLLAAGYMPFIMIFNQLGLPNLQSKFFFLIFLSNVIFNLILIPWLGVYGAAFGTALSLVVSVILLKLFVTGHFRIMI